MGIFFKIVALWSSICFTSIIIGKLLNATKTDYINFLIGLIIGFVLMIILDLLGDIFPNMEKWL